MSVRENSSADPLDNELVSQRCFDSMLNDFVETLTLTSSEAAIIRSGGDWVGMLLCNPTKNQDIDSLRQKLFGEVQRRPDKFSLLPQFSSLERFIPVNSSWYGRYQRIGSSIHTGSTVASQRDGTPDAGRPNVRLGVKYLRTKITAALLVVLGGVTVVNNESAMNELRTLGNRVSKRMSDVLGKKPETFEDFETLIRKARIVDDVDGVRMLTSEILEKFGNDPQMFGNLYPQAVEAYTMPRSLDRKVVPDWQKGFGVAEKGLDFARSKASEPGLKQKQWSSLLHQSVFGIAYDAAYGLSGERFHLGSQDALAPVESVLAKWQEASGLDTDSRLEGHLLELAAQKIMHTRDSVLSEQLSREGLEHAWKTFGKGRLVNSVLLQQVIVLLHDSEERDLIAGLQRILSKREAMGPGYKGALWEKIADIMKSAATPEDGIRGLCVYSRELQAEEDMNVAGKSSPMQ